MITLQSRITWPYPDKEAVDSTIYKLLINEHGEWSDTFERGTKAELLQLMADAPQLYADIPKHRITFSKCKDQSPMDRAYELSRLISGYVRM